MDIGYHSGRLHGCRCNTQQGTRVTLPFASCMNYVETVAFDPAIPDRGSQSQLVAGVGGAGDRGAATPAQAAYQPSSVAVSGITNVRGSIR